MVQRSNFLIGYGERLASDMAAPIAGAAKKHPYSFAEARHYLARQEAGDPVTAPRT
ncbi:hypothetical protein [Bradyrhizobium sp. Tv2a-2]|uniref:hypothetical protein n=1 Tax=Bradyrhizobium sp. Tv2a-2 TaxID=113395 RepID=UPI000415E984|nr:hypothetical protein [Bradyrhizobium sp. Tv2a-2]